MNNEYSKVLIHRALGTTLFIMLRDNNKNLLGYYIIEAKCIIISIIYFYINHY